MKISGIRVRIGLVAALVLALVSPAVGQNVIGSYQAYIGTQDLYNSNGVALSAPWQVIRQDRANVHKFGIRQTGDQSDNWFGSAENRAALETWVMNGSMDPTARAKIMAGGATIHVEILGQGNNANVVRITVY